MLFYYSSRTSGIESDDCHHRTLVFFVRYELTSRDQRSPTSTTSSLSPLSLSVCLCLSLSLFSAYSFRLLFRNIRLTENYFSETSMLCSKTNLTTKLHTVRMKKRILVNVLTLRSNKTSVFYLLSHGRKSHTHTHCISFSILDSNQIRLARNERTFAIRLNLTLAGCKLSLIGSLLSSLHAFLLSRSN